MDDCQPAFRYQEDQRQPARLLGAQLRKLRERSGMTALLLSSIAGIHNTRLSRIERGHVSPRIDEVTAILAALDADEMLQTSMLAAAQELHASSSESGWVIPRSMEESQRLIGKWQDERRHVQWFEPLGIPGPLQTPEYVRATFRPDAIFPADAASEHQREQAIEGRLRNQLALFDVERRYEFLLLESSFTARHVNTRAMVGQIHRVIAAMTQPNVRLGVIPSHVELPLMAMANFRITNGEIVQVEPMAGIAYATSPQIIKTLQDVFRALDEVALHDDDAVKFLHSLAVRMHAAEVDIDLAGSVAVAQ